MLEVDLALLARGLKRNAKQKDVEKCFCQIFGIDPSLLTPDKLNSICSGLWFGNEQIPVENATNENKHETMRYVLQNVYETFNGDDNRKSFTYYDGYVYNGIKVKEPKQPSLWMKFAHAIFGAYKEEFDQISQEGINRRNDINNGENVRTAAEREENLRSSSANTVKTPLLDAINMLQDPNVSVQQKRYIKNEIAIQQYLRNNALNVELNDLIMFSDENAREMSKSELLFKQKAFSQGAFTDKRLLNQADRMQTRVNCVRMLMLAKGASFERVFSDDPKYDEDKRAAANDLKELMAKNDLKKVMLIYSRAVEKFNEISFPGPGSTMNDKLLFNLQHRNHFLLGIDIAQFIPSKNTDEYKNAYNSLSEQEKKNFDKAQNTINNFNNYQRCLPTISTSLCNNPAYMKSDAILSGQKIIPENMYSEKILKVYEGKKASDLDFNRMTVLFNGYSAITVNRGNDPDRNEIDEDIDYYGKALTRKAARDITEVLNLDVNKLVEDAYNSVNKVMPDKVKKIDHTKRDNIEEIEFELNAGFVGMTEAALIDINSNIIHGPAPQNNVQFQNELMVDSQLVNNTVKVTQKVETKEVNDMQIETIKNPEN